MHSCDLQLFSELLVLKRIHLDVDTSPTHIAVLFLHNFFCMIQAGLQWQQQPRLFAYPKINTQKHYLKKITAGKKLRYSVLLFALNIPKIIQCSFTQ